MEERKLVENLFFLFLMVEKGGKKDTVRLTSIYYRVPGNQNFRFTPTETLDRQVKKIKSPTCDMV